MKILILLMCLLKLNALMLKKECKSDEIHKSCSFYQEYTCWENEQLTNRVKNAPKRLAHCTSGCYCKKNMVRAYPGGRCITMLACRDLEIQAVLNKIPEDISNF